MSVKKNCVRHTFAKTVCTLAVNTRVTRCHFAKNDGSFLRAVSNFEAEACAIVSKVLVELERMPSHHV